MVISSLVFLLVILLSSHVWGHDARGLSFPQLKRSRITCTPDAVFITHPEVELGHWGSSFIPPVTLREEDWEPYNSTTFCKTEPEICLEGKSENSKTIFWETSSARHNILPLQTHFDHLFNDLTKNFETMYTAWIAAKAPGPLVAFLKASCLCETRSAETNPVVDCRGEFKIANFFYWKHHLIFVQDTQSASASLVSVEFHPLENVQQTSGYATPRHLDDNTQSWSKNLLMFQKNLDFRVKFKTEVKTVGFQGVGYPNYCYLTVNDVNKKYLNNTTCSSSANQSSTHITNLTSTCSTLETQVKFLEDGCPVSNQWDFKIDHIETRQHENEFHNTMMASFSLAGLPKNFPLKYLREEGYSLEILCNIGVIQNAESIQSEIEERCKNQSVSRRFLRLDPIKRNDFSSYSMKPKQSSANDETALVAKLMEIHYWLPKNASEKADKKYPQEKHETIDSTGYSLDINTIANFRNLDSKESPLNGSFSDDVLNMKSTQRPCNPEKLAGDKDVYYAFERHHNTLILRCSDANLYTKLFLKMVNSFQEEEALSLSQNPLSEIQDVNTAQVVVDSTIPSPEAQIKEDQQNSSRVSFRRSPVHENGLETMERSTTDKNVYYRNGSSSPRESTTADRLANYRRYEVRPLRRNFQLKQQYHGRRNLEEKKKALLHHLENETYDASRNFSSHLPFRLRNYNYVPKIQKSEEILEDIYSQLYTEKIEKSFYEYREVMKSSSNNQNATGLLKNLTDDGSKKMKSPEFIHLSEPYEQESQDISVEPPNRGFLGIGRYVPQAQSSIYKVINQISYGPWFVKWGRNKMEKASQVVVATDFGFVDASISGTQKEFSLGGGIGLLTGTLSYNEIKQESALSVALGNFGVKVDRSQTYNASAIEIFARSFQASTLLNFVDRSFGQRIRIRDFEISLQHDFDDFFYPSDPGYGTEFSVHYKGAGFSLANDIAQRKLGVSFGVRGHSVAVLHDFNQYVSEIQANWGRGWQLGFGWDFPDMYSQSIYAEAGFGKMNRAFIQVGAGIGDDGVPQASAKLKTRNIGINVDFLYEFGQRTMQYAFTAGRFSYIWQANIDLSAVRLPTFLGIRPADVEHLLLSLLPQSIES